MDTIINNSMSSHGDVGTILFALVTRLVVLGSMISILAYITYYGFLSPLSGIPGPFIARFTRLWLAYHGWKGDFHIVLTEIHEKYGTTVRVGPDEVLTLSPDAIKKIYGTRKPPKDDRVVNRQCFLIFLLLYRCGIYVQ